MESMRLRWHSNIDGVSGIEESLLLHYIAAHRPLSHVVVVDHSTHYCITDSIAILLYKVCEQEECYASFYY